MVVRSIGNSLMVILPDLVGKKITNWFDLVRPLIAFKFQTVGIHLLRSSCGDVQICSATQINQSIFARTQILNRTNNIFELVTVEPVPDQTNGPNKLELLIVDNDGDEEKTLRLKGQMIYMENWRMIMFLGTPVMPDLTALVNTGLYINDLSMHDFSRYVLNVCSQIQ